MRPALLLAPLIIVLTLATACSNSETPPPTETPAQAFEPSAEYSPTRQPSPTPGPTFDRTPVPVPGQWDQSAVWTAYFDGSDLYDNCYPALEMACVIRTATEESVAPAGIAFIETHETILVYFEELGAVDFGDVAWLGINMGRPEPVFLNGGFGLLYYGSLIPEGWRDLDPSYAALPLDDGIGPFSWAEYSQLAESSSDADGQRIVVETVIQECRACPPLAFMPLEVAFNGDGTLTGVTVLPMRCESDANPGISPTEIEESPCYATP